jgi:hypothetical protein
MEQIECNFPLCTMHFGQLHDLNPSTDGSLSVILILVKLLEVSQYTSIK